MGSVRRAFAPGGAAGAGIVLATAVAAAGARGGVAAASSFGKTCGVMLAGTGPGGAGDALGAPACASSLHAFCFFLRRTTPSGGFGVTSARHDERAANTPW